MISMADTNLNTFLPTFASAGVPVAFLVPTPTGFGKSIMDATFSVRKLLFNAGVHDYSSQLQGPENKVLMETYLVSPNTLIKTETSLYRPRTKLGDPRIWIYKLKQYCSPCNLLALTILGKKLYVFNLSNPSIGTSLISGGFCKDVLDEISQQENAIANELLGKLREIHNQGFLPSITDGDPGVGDTLEHALGISRNNIAAPDYKVIELKTTRLTRYGKKKATTRSTLFTKVPDEGMTYRQIVDNYGKIQTPRDSAIARLQLYETLRYSRANAYDLVLSLDSGNDKLLIEHESNNSRSFVSAWFMDTLRHSLLTKHKETFWVKAQSEMKNNQEYFRYDIVFHTKHPNVSLLEPLIETDKITVDLAAHYKPDGKWRDHGVLFKMNPEDLSLLLGEPVEYIL